MSDVNVTIEVDVERWALHHFGALYQVSITIWVVQANLENTTPGVWNFVSATARIAPARRQPPLG